MARAKGVDTAKSERVAWIACTVWVRYTDVEGKRTVRSHETWNADLFMRNRAEEAAHANVEFAKEHKRGKGKAKVERITQAQFDKERA